MLGRQLGVRRDEKLGWVCIVRKDAMVGIDMDKNGIQGEERDLSRW